MDNKHKENEYIIHVKKKISKKVPYPGGKNVRSSLAFFSAH